MAITGADPATMTSDSVITLPVARRFEAAGLRAWPAARARYDGAWVIRMTPDSGSKRLNSVNLLDPADVADIEARVERAAQDYAQYGRPVTFRISPLAGPELSAWFDARGWQTLTPSIVMRRALSGLPLDAAVDQVPMQDVGRFALASARVHGETEAEAAGLAGVIGSITSEYGLFAIGDEESPVATVICVNEGDAAGIFNLATRPSERGRGHGRRAVLTALKWARGRGARQAWLQVEAGNTAGVNLYRSLGFDAIYSYHYRRPNP